MSVLVCIVNFRVADLVIECLRSLESEIADLPGSHVAVVDNDSGDDSAETIRGAIETHGWQDWISFDRLDTNRGFAAGNNHAIRLGLKQFQPDPPRYVMLLNPDTYIRPQAIRTLVDHMDEHPDVGVAGSRLEDPDGTPQHSRFRFPGLVNQLDDHLALGPLSRLLKRQATSPPVVDEAHETSWVAGASMLIRREVLDDVGLLDEGYFLYFEETDFCLRARRAGWTSWYVPKSRVVHLIGRSSGVTARDRPRQRRPAYWFESRRLYFVKNHGALYTALVDLLSILGSAVRRLRYSIERKEHTDPPHFLRDLIAHSIFIRGPRV